MTALLNEMDFLKIMRKLNINTNDIVFVDSMISNEVSPIKLNNLLSLLINYLGEKGSIIMSMAGHNFNLNEEFRVKSIKDEEKLKLLSYDNSIELFIKDNLAKCLYKLKESKISNNPFFPFVAYGKYSDLLVSDQALDFGYGHKSPFAILEQVHAKALLINHDIVSFKLNNYLFESDVAANISVSGGLYNNEYYSFLTKKVDEDMIKKLFDQKKYKQMFYYDEKDDLDFLSVDVNEYVNYCRKFKKEY